MVRVAPFFASDAQDTYDGVVLYRPGDGFEPQGDASLERSYDAQEQVGFR